MSLSDKDILKKLHDQGTGFKTPKDYFDSVEDRFTQTRINETDGFELPEIETKHSLNIEKATGFKVPDGYFTHDVDRFLPAQNKGLRIRKLSYVKASVMAIAASLLLFIGVKFYSYDQHEIQLSELELNEISLWVDEDLIAFDSYEIAEAFDEIKLESDLYSDEDILGYLNNVDMEDIIFDN